MRSGYSSRILLISSVPMPEPVPPPSEWHTWKPARMQPRAINEGRPCTLTASPLLPPAAWRCDVSGLADLQHAQAQGSPGAQHVTNTQRSTRRCKLQLTFGSADHQQASEPAETMQGQCDSVLCSLRAALCGPHPLDVDSMHHSTWTVLLTVPTPVLLMIHSAPYASAFAGLQCFGSGRPGCLLKSCSAGKVCKSTATKLPKRGHP